MKSSLINAVLYAASLVRLAVVMAVPENNIYLGACHAQGCNTCNVEDNVMEGYPNCLVYQSADAVGQGYAASSGNGYDV
nr:hypothetical protein CFP56_33401 [Quercus suber]